MAPQTEFRQLRVQLTWSGVMAVLTRHTPGEWSVRVMGPDKILEVPGVAPDTETALRMARAHVAGLRHIRRRRSSDKGVTFCGAQPTPNDLGPRQPSRSERTAGDVCVACCIEMGGPR